MNKNYNAIFEGIWAVMTIVCIISGIHQTINEGFGESYMFFILAVIAFLMFLIRRHKRKTSVSKTDNESSEDVNSAT